MQAASYLIAALCCYCITTYHPDGRRLAECVVIDQVSRTETLEFVTLEHHGGTSRSDPTSPGGPCTVALEVQEALIYIYR
jgi:hypothetical protein